MKFVVDLPLGGLAKWLRFCGFDTICRRFFSNDLKSLPPPEADTYLLTRQRLLERPARPDLLILNGDNSEEQLEEVLHRLGIPPQTLCFLSRCSHCNEPLRLIPREQAQGRVPEFILHRHRQFYECPGCRRLYWPGSHLEGISRVLERMAEKSLRRDAEDAERELNGEG